MSHVYLARPTACLACLACHGSHRLPGGEVITARWTFGRHSGHNAWSPHSAWATPVEKYLAWCPQCNVRLHLYVRCRSDRNIVQVCSKSRRIHFHIHCCPSVEKAAVPRQIKSGSLAQNMAVIRVCCSGPPSPPLSLLIKSSVTLRTHARLPRPPARPHTTPPTMDFRLDRIMPAL